MNTKIKNIQISGGIEQYLRNQQHNQLLRFLTCGSVDDGKSTLIGRLLHDTHHVFSDQLSILYRDSKRFSSYYDNKLNLALLVDGLQDERSQGITIDVAYRYFSTKKRKFIIADTPGHEQYTRNMVTGASTSDLAVLLIDARKGLLEQTKRHTIISILLGIRFFIVVINKMDLVNFDLNIFKKIETAYLDFFRQLSEDLYIICIPISALNGDNVIKISNNMPWYNGVTLLNALENIDIANCNTQQLQLLSLRFPVQYVINCCRLDFRGYSGMVAGGRAYVGQQIQVFPSEQKSKIDRIVTFDGDCKEAYIGQSISILLSDNIDVSRGSLIVDNDNSSNISHVTRYIQVNVVWMSEQELLIGQMFDIKVACKMSRARVKRIRYQIDVNNLYYYFVNSLSLNSIGLVDLVLDEPLFFDNYSDNHITGGIIFIDRLTNITVGMGMIQKLFISDVCCIDNNIYTDFELELNSLICHYYPHWGTRNLLKK